MLYWIGQLADKTGLTVRALHHYDRIGLLRPVQVTEAGYRLYDEEALLLARQIVLLKELDFSLFDIRTILHAPGADREEALRRQIDLLKLRRAGIERIIALAEGILKGEEQMDWQNRKDGEYRAAKDGYRAEAEARWGHMEEFQESRRREKAYGPAEWKTIQGEMEDIFRAFASLAGREDPASDAAAALTERWRGHVDRCFYPCDRKRLAGLADLYEADDRFAAYLDRFGEGNARFIIAAFRAYAG